MRGLISLLTIFCLMAASANAADFSPIEDKVFHCKYLMQGEIVKGDAEKLQKILSENRIQSYPPPNNGYPDRICLDSPGGNLLEAIKMASVYSGHGGTAIRAGERCESACAIFFMSGGYKVEDGYFAGTDRVLNPLGKLGFHAPSLHIPEGVYQKESVERAYNIALQGVAEIKSLATVIDIPATLVIAMLRTPSSEMMYIEKVGQASRWDIHIAPTKPHALTSETVFPKVLEGACGNVAGRTVEMQLDTQIGRNMGDGSDIPWKGDGKPKVSRSKDSIDVEYHPLNVFFELSCFLELPRSLISKRLFTTTDVQIPAGTEKAGEFNLRPFSFFPGAMQISLLAPDQDISPEMAERELQASDVSGMKLYNGYDLDGGDLSVLRKIDRNLCIQRCKSETGCTAITYDLWNDICILKSFTRGSGRLLLQPKSVTYLQSELAGQVKYSNSPIRFKRRDNRSFSGVAYSVVVQSNREQCQKQCQGEEKCHAYGYHSTLGECSFYHLPMEYFPTQRNYIGIKEQLN